MGGSLISRPTLVMMAFAAMTVGRVVEGQSIPCSTEMIELNVSNVAEALALGEALACSGTGQFHVTWEGEVFVNTTTVVSDGKHLKIIGFPEKETAAGVVNGGDGVPLFEVMNSSLLEISHLSLRGGAAGGSAISASGSSEVIVTDCNFTENTGAYKGGAIYADSATVTVAGNTSFVRNSAELSGGAIFLTEQSNLSVNGASTWASNTAADGGGAIRAVSASVSIDGDSFFTANSAFNGGAIRVLRGSLDIAGGATFESNYANLSGGAVHADLSSLTVSGQMLWADNTAVGAGGGGGALFVDRSNLTVEGLIVWRKNSAHLGGAIKGENSTMSIDGASFFTSNTADWWGGAVTSVESDLFINGHTTWTNNTSNGIGGAICIAYDAILNIHGHASFFNNTAIQDGGAIYVSDATFALEPGAYFSRNRALDGSGGGVYCRNTVATIDGAVFKANAADWGGGVAMFSSGSTEDKGGPTIISDCGFEQNSATQDGGAMYSSAGYDDILATRFEDNFAANSGGAFFQNGVLVWLANTTFVGNTAGNEGLGVMSHGQIQNMANVTFSSNTFQCGEGTYGYDKDQSEVSDTCRFEVSCALCGDCQWNATEAVLYNDSVPVCEAVPIGVDASDVGSTLQTLRLEPGYFRTSDSSHAVLECHRMESCLGGVDPSTYCSSGYEGPYCAVCQEGYASGFRYSCRSCRGEFRKSAIGAGSAVAVMILGILILVVVDLVRVEHGPGDRTTTTHRLERALSSWHDRISKVVPLTSIKVVLVVWQIITQFTAVVDIEYPKVYQDFLSVLDLLNFNIGTILSLSCVVSTNFYGDLAFVTISPLLLLGALGATYTVSMRRNGNSPEGMFASKRKHASIVLFLAFIIYSSVSYTVFQTFVCDSLEGDETYLRADYSLKCGTPSHVGAQVYAGVMVCLYPIGIPATLAWWLRNNRHDIGKLGESNVATHRSRKEIKHLQAMEYLWAPYTPRRYYYEVIEFGRRIALTGLAAFLLPGTAAQVAIEVVFATLCLAVFETLSPFVNPLDEWVYRSGAWVVFFSMFLALLLKVDASNEDSHSQILFARVLVAANIGLVIMIVVQAVWSAAKEFSSGKDTPVARVGPRRGDDTENGRSVEKDLEET